MNSVFIRYLGPVQKANPPALHFETHLDTPGYTIMLQRASQTATENIHVLVGNGADVMPSGERQLPALREPNCGNTGLVVLAAAGVLLRTIRHIKRRVLAPT